MNDRRYSRLRLVWVLSEGTGFKVMSRYVPKLDAPYKVELMRSVRFLSIYR